MIQNPDFFTEEAVLDLAKARASKLLGLKEHLKTLLNKKIRLEFEIKQLEKAIKNKQRMRSKSFKLKVGLEADQTFDSETVHLIRQQSPDLYSAIVEGDVLAKEISELLKSEELVSESEAENLRLYL